MTEESSPNPSMNRTLFVIHGWSAVMLGLLLYAVIVTGSVAVLAKQISHWTSPLSARAPLLGENRQLDTLVRGFAQSLHPAYHDIVVRSGSGGRVRLQAQSGRQNAKFPRVVADFDAQSGRRVHWQQGEAPSEDSAVAADMLARFFVEIHVRLHLPRPWGLILTGVLGVAMLVAAISGFVLHKHLLRELFSLRLSARNPLLSQRDKHMLAGSWNLLFAILLAFTGCFFSFATSIGIPAMAMVSFAGDQQRLINVIVGDEVEPDASPVPMANLHLMLDHARALDDDQRVAVIRIDRWGQADSRVSIESIGSSQRLSAQKLEYRARDGHFLGEKPAFGREPSMGNTVASLMTPLHFGNFAGLLSKLAWAALGAASAYVVVSGLALWSRRRHSSRRWRLFERLINWVVLGLPIGMAGAAIGLFSSQWLSQSAYLATRQGFVLAVTLALLLAIVCGNHWRQRRNLLLMCGVLLLTVPLLRWLSGGMGWIQASMAGWYELVAIDWFLLASAVGCLIAMRADSHSIEKETVSGV